MLNRKLGASEASFYNWANAGTAKAAGAVILIGSIFGVLQTDVAASGIGCAQVGGVFEVTKQAADAMTQGQIVGFDIANQRADSSMAGCLEVWEAPPTNATKVKLRFPNVAKPLKLKYTATAQDNTDNFCTINSGLGATPPNAAVQVQIQTAAGVMRSPQGAVEWLTGGDLGKIKIADSGLAASEIVHLVIHL